VAHCFQWPLRNALIPTAIAITVVVIGTIWLASS